MCQPLPSGSDSGFSRVSTRSRWYWCRKCQPTGIMLPTAPTSRPIRHHAMPDRNSANAPAAVTSTAVPRSGCSAISPAGIAISRPTTAMSFQPGGNWRGCRYQATIIGMVSLSSSDGWKRMKPRSSQRIEPRPSPRIATTTSNAVLPPYNHGVQLRSTEGGMRDTSSSRPAPSTKRPAWPPTRDRLASPALYSVTNPAIASTNRPSASGRSIRGRVSIRRRKRRPRA